ncbi:MAG: DNA polymerase III subunit beta [Actinobacteria bacterium]|nr:MAG: DNA polymerase III subunit beta [Actinomycetota bacterium]
MKLRCERDVLVEALTTAGRAVSSRGGATQVLSGIRLEVTGDRLHVAGSDLDLTIEVELTAAGGEDGACVLPARLVADIVRALEPGAVTLEADDDEARIVAGRSQFAVRTFPIGDFPRLPRVGGEGVVITAGDFTEALRQVVRAASSDDARPMLTGVLMSAEESGLRLVATDSYRLAVRDLPGTTVLSEGQHVLVPARALGELQRLLSGTSGGADRPVTLYIGEFEASFETGTVRLTTRLIEGEFPNYRQLLPATYPNRLSVDKETLLDAVRRVKLLVKDATTPVRVALRPEGIDLRVVTQEVGQASEDVDAKYEGGPDLTIAFNPSYLMDGVEAIVGSEVILETIDSTKPATVRSTENDNFRYLLMPVRVS